jgi:hypothetical protein
MVAFEVVPTARLAFWALISRTFSTLKDQPLLIFSLTAMSALPANLLEWVGGPMAYSIVSSFLGTVSGGAIAYGVFKALEEEDFVSPGQALSRTLSWPIVGIALILVLMSAFDLILGLGGVEFAAVLAKVVLLGLIFYLYSTCLVVIVPVCVIEELGPLASLQRSLELTRSHRRRIFFLLMGVTCLLIVPSFLLVYYGLSTALSGGAFLPSAGVYPTTLTQLGAYMIYLVMFEVLLMAFCQTMSAIIYCDLRAIWENEPKNNF